MNDCLIQVTAYFYKKGDKENASFLDSENVLFKKGWEEVTCEIVSAEKPLNSSLHTPDEEIGCKFQFEGSTTNSDTPDTEFTENTIGFQFGPLVCQSAGYVCCEPSMISVLRDENGWREVCDGCFEYLEKVAMKLAQIEDKEEVADTELEKLRIKQRKSPIEPKRIVFITLWEYNGSFDYWGEYDDNWSPVGVVDLNSMEVRKDIP